MRTVITTTNSLSVRSVRNVSIDIANESGWEGYEESLVSQAEFVLERLRIHPRRVVIGIGGRRCHVGFARAVDG